MRYKICLSYDGTHYGGWQIQPNTVTVQQLLQDALSQILSRPTHATGSGRTDAGVHALEQVAHFDTGEPIDPIRTQKALNGLLPPDIRILCVTPVSDTFHARYSARGKTYRYHISTASAHDPFSRHYSQHIYYPLDPSLFEATLNQFVGTHDFTSFANKATQGAAARSAVRTIHHFTLTRTPHGYTLEVHGNGFLYKMVRNMIGAALQVASGKLPLARIQELLLEKDRRKAPMAAPAKGLFLAKVHYDTSDQDCQPD